MSTKRCRSARASFFTSTLALAATLGLPPAAAAAGFAELELQLARSGDVYLLLDLRVPALEVRTRATLLETLPLAGAALYRFRTLGAAGDLTVALPATWTVTEDVAAAYRQVVAPERLEPFSPEGEAAAGRRPAAPTPERPAAYRVTLDSGFVLAVGAELPASGIGSRFAQALENGWLRLRGRAPERPDLVALAMAADDARQLHHLLRPGTVLLVTHTAAPAAETAGGLSE
jgi:hypothetical protein